MTHLLSVYGVARLMACFGLLRIGEPKAGETVVRSRDKSIADLAPVGGGGQAQGRGGCDRRHREHALIGLLAGENRGKRMVRAA